MDNKDYNNHIVPCCTKTVTYSMDTSVPSYKVETKVEACNVPDCPSKNRGLCMIL
uniref:Uncharacterized protein n=1 Tax=Meloidogyne incognita TaxID=6306 RepID=A0A914KW93_MELIC